MSDQLTKGMIRQIVAKQTKLARKRDSLRKFLAEVNDLADSIERGCDELEDAITALERAADALSELV